MGLFDRFKSKPVSRRSFLKSMGVAAGAVVAAPILPSLVVPAQGIVRPQTAPYIPSQNLELGVPQQRPRQLDDMEWSPGPSGPGELEWVRASRSARASSPVLYSRTVEVLMVQTTYYSPAGGPLTAGSSVRVDETTAGRWVDYGIAVPPPGQYIAPDQTRRILEQQRMNEYRVPAPAPTTGWERFS